MKCRPGDFARIIHSVNPSNIGRVVKVVEYIGKYAQGEQFEAHGMTCTCLVHDHYWWIEGDDIDIQLGPSPKAYIADSWLEPIKPDKEEKREHVEQQLDMFI
jgi:hypothetical protein|tara:strand:- start:306 stop:611 length:306 start_codon:yes stop_codon:yes gene_type:complete